MVDVLQTTFEIEVDGDQYIFRVPSIRQDMEVSYKAADVRRRAYPDGGGSLGAIDYAAVKFSQYCAYLELYLVKSTTLWPYGFDDSDLSKVDPANPPKVNFEAFPADRLDTVYLVGDRFEAEAARFRKRGNSGNGSAGVKAVDGQ